MSTAAALARARLRRLLRILPLLLLPALGGCLSGLFSSNQAPQQAYVLRLQAPGGAADSSSPGQASAIPPAGSAADGLQVLLPVAVAGLNGDGIAVLRPGQQLDYYSGAHWAAPAPSLLQSLVIEALRRQGSFSLVESDTGPFDAGYLLSLELTHFEADYADNGPPTVRVELVCALGPRVGRILVESFTAQSAVAADADRMQAVVAAFQRATNDAVTQLAAHIVPPGPPTPRGPPQR